MGFFNIRESILTPVKLHLKEEVTMKKLFCVILLTAGLGLLVLSCQKSPNPMDATAAPQKTAGSLAKVTDNEISDTFEQDVWVPCAAGGAGENLHISGRWHILNIQNENANNSNGKWHFQVLGVTGVGATTGDLYHATGLTQCTWTSDIPWDPWTSHYEETYVSNFHMIGVGSAVNFTDKVTWHLTFTSNGKWTVAHEIEPVKCN